MSEWTIAASWPVILIGIFLWGLALRFSWIHWRGRAFRKSIAWLEGCRVVIITLLILTFLKPERLSRVERVEKPVLAVLSDVSGSMQTSDVIVSNAVISRSAWVAQALESEFYRPLEAYSRIELIDFAAPPAPTEANEAPGVEGTDLSLALDEVLQQFEYLKGVILLSDGDWNLGAAPLGSAVRYRDRKVPVFTVAVGRQQPLPDLSLEDANVPSYGLLGEQISLPVRLRNDYPREITAPLRLLDGDQVLTQKEVILAPGTEIQDALVWEPREIGERELRLELGSQPDELMLDNNDRAFRIGIRMELLNVLVVDAEPRWEYRYLRNALERDPGVQMHCLLFHPGMALGSGRGYLSAFPPSREWMMDYDVVFLGDVGQVPNQLKESDLDLIRGLVEQQAGGLVFIPGSQGRQRSLTDGPLGDLIPVVFDPEKPQGIALQNESQLVLSSTGKEHWLTRFDADAQRNDELWRQLPGFYWSAAVQRSRPGSEVLAVHSSLRNSRGRIPLLVTRPFGSGKVLFMGTDSAWRWRRGVEDKYHYRFWSQVVRWMAHQRHLSQSDGMRFAWSPETIEVGETAYLQATVTDISGYPAQDGKVQADIVSPLGNSERIDFDLVEGGWGVFKASFQPRESGKHHITLQADKHGRKLETSFTVIRPVVEKIGHPINLPALQEIASVSQGQVVDIADLSAMVEVLRSMPEPEPREIRYRLWSDPWWGGFLLSLLAGYWVGRKLAGLV